jgi:hypothetical protein
MNKLLTITLLSILALSTIADEIEDVSTTEIEDVPVDPATEAEIEDPFVKECLDIHNKAREVLDIEPFTYSDELAKSAQKWANTIAKSNSLKHSQGRNKIGENLAMGTTGVYTTDKLINLWVNEKRYFRNRAFGNQCSTTGQWKDVAHYTQMIWRNTKEVGCALGKNSKNTFMVCHYKPTGNWVGDFAY